MQTTLSFTITGIRHETPDTATYIMQPLDAGFTYQAGQFLTLVFTFEQREVRRSYSFSTAPGIDPAPAITVKRVPNGEISRYIHRYWKIGTIVHALPAAGRFLPDTLHARRDIFLFGAGSGITPLLSLLKATLASESQTHVHLFYSNRSIPSTIFYEELLQWQQQYPERFHLQFFFSDSKLLSTARLGKPLLQQMVPGRLIYPPQYAQFYLCGPRDYMQMATIGIQSLGFKASQIRREIFAIDEPGAPRIEWADKSSKQVEIRLNGQTYFVVAEYDQSVMDAALKANIPVPYSCRAGQCSTCMASCRSGKILMTNNEVLTPKDEARGLVLTCVGYALTDPVKIDYDDLS